MTTICGVAAATFKDPTPENVRAKKLTFVCDLCVSVMVFQLFFFFVRYSRIIRTEHETGVHCSSVSLFLLSSSMFLMSMSYVLHCVGVEMVNRIEHKLEIVLDGPDTSEIQSIKLLTKNCIERKMRFSVYVFEWQLKQNFY